MQVSRSYIIQRQLNNSKMVQDRAIHTMAVYNLSNGAIFNDL